MAEYRAFDKHGAIIGSDELTDTDAALAWGIGIVGKGAVLVERRDGENWVCFQEYRKAREASRTTPGS